LILNDGGKPAVLSTSAKTMEMASLSLANHSVFMAVSTSVPITSTMTSQSLWRSDSATTDSFWLGGHVTFSLTNERLIWLTVEGNVYGAGQVSNDYPSGGYLVQATWDGSAPSVFMNTQQQTLTPSTDGNFTATRYPRAINRISGNSSGTQGFNGRISEFVLYPSAQTANRVAIAANMNSRQGIY
jgi:hypothetical protein